jgi:thiamine-phosphate pyrophosphorylase
VSDGAVFRILDASLNRANEGLRTIEEFARFACDNPGWTERTKKLRHDLATAFGPVDARRLLSNRDTLSDCGTTISTPSEMKRQSINDVVTAAFARVQQSLRSIEEYGKLASTTLAIEVEAIRYRSYTLEKDITLGTARSNRLRSARLYILVDVSGPPDVWLARIRNLVIHGADIIQIRDKRCDDRTLWDRSRMAADLVCREMASDAEGNRCQLIINDRPDVAAAVEADGVHVGQDELPTSVVRKIVGENKLVGLSTHTLQQVREASVLGADYIGCGPTFPSNTKSFDTFAGVAFAEEATKISSLPAFAIGGIDQSNLQQLLDVGVRRIAASGCVWGSADEAGICRALATRLKP